MEQNVGKIDKIVRVIIAALFVYLGSVYSPWIYIIPALLIFTVITGHCGPYKLFGINTNK